MSSQPDSTNAGGTQTSRHITTGNGDVNQRKQKMDTETVAMTEQSKKKHRGENLVPSSEDLKSDGISSGSYDGLLSQKTTNKASLRTMQLVRMQHSISSETANAMGEVLGGSEVCLRASSHSQVTSMAADRQRIFASLVQAASAVPEQSFFQPQQVSASLPNSRCESFEPQQCSGQLNRHNRNDRMAPQNKWNQSSQEAYFQYQAFKRFQEQQQQQQCCHQFVGHVSSTAAGCPRFNSGTNVSYVSSHSMQGGACNMVPYNVGNSGPGYQVHRRFVSNDGSAVNHIPAPPQMMGQDGHHALENSRAHTLLHLPAILARPEDAHKISIHQVLLRHQMEAFQATEDDVATHTRGRNKPIKLGQVGIRCRHCAHLPVVHRQRGSTYFPANMFGLYQAAQNMSTTHIQCGLCNFMPVGIKMQFADLLSTKVSSSGAGRPYWAESGKKMGLVDTDEGIFFFRNLPPGKWR